jgi:multiple sugar transport system substrate-binding protein
METPMQTHRFSRRRLLAGLSAAALPRVAYAQTLRAPVKLVIANSQWVDALRGRNLWNAITKYQQAAPNVQMEQEAIPSAEFDNKIMTELGGGQGPDLLMAQEGVFYTIAEAGFLVDVGRAVEGVRNLNGTNDNGIIEGKRLGIGWHRAAYALIYNKPLLDAAGARVPTTLDELIASARAVTAATGAIGFTSRHLIADFFGWFLDFQNWAYGYGVNWSDGRGKLTLNTPEAVAAVSAFKKMYDARIIPYGDNMPTQRTRFKERGVGFSIDNSGGTLNIASGGPLSGRDLYAAPLPFPHPGAHQQIFIGVSRHSRQQGPAMDFLRWLVSAEGQQSLREASGPDALATDVPVTPEFAANNPWAQTFADLAKTSRSTLIPKFEVQTADIMRLVMEGVERVIVGNADPRAVLADAQRRADQRF